MGWTQYAGPVITCCLAVASAIHDVKKKGIIQWHTILVIIGAIVYMGFEFFNKATDSAESENKHNQVIETLVKNSDSIKANVDSGTNTIKVQTKESTDKILSQGSYTQKKLDSLQQEINSQRPLIDLEMEMTANNQSDSLGAHLALSNLGGLAKNVRESAIFILAHNRTYTISQTFRYRVDESKLLVKGAPDIVISHFSSDVKLRDLDTLYIKSNLDFDDYYGKKCPTVRKIFRFTGKEFNVRLQPVTSEKYYKFKDELTNMKRW